MTVHSCLTSNGIWISWDDFIFQNNKINKKMNKTLLLESLIGPKWFKAYRLWNQAWTQIPAPLLTGSVNLGQLLDLSDHQVGLVYHGVCDGCFKSCISAWVEEEPHGTLQCPTLTSPGHIYYGNNPYLLVLKTQKARFKYFPGGSRINWRVQTGLQMTVATKSLAGLYLLLSPWALIFALRVLILL